MSNSNPQIQNLFQSEEWIILSLKNMKYQVALYLKELTKLESRYDISENEKRLNRFREIFTYYHNDLIPALQESADMEERHLELLKRNPDASFTPLKSEVEFQQKIAKRFADRFKDLHQEFHAFIIEVKSNSQKLVP